MPDRLYLSYRLRGFTAQNMLRHFEKALRVFPFSRLRPGAAIAVYAVEIAERRFSSAPGPKRPTPARYWPMPDSSAPRTAP
jgi:hypothetical protein